MRDLKHLLYFENLLQEANNELVQQAVKEDGKIALGYTCYHVPEVLLNLDNCFSVRLRAPRTGSVDIATYYLSPFICGFAKACSSAESRAATDFCPRFLQAKRAAR